MNPLEWRMDMENAPKDRVVIAMGRYPDAAAGFPRFVMWAGRYWADVGRINPPLRVICWAWIDREVLPPWPEQTEEARHAV